MSTPFTIAQYKGNGSKDNLPIEMIWKTSIVCVTFNNKTAYILLYWLIYNQQNQPITWFLIPNSSTDSLHTEPQITMYYVDLPRPSCTNFYFLHWMQCAENPCKDSKLWYTNHGIHATRIFDIINGVLCRILCSTFSVKKYILGYNSYVLGERGPMRKGHPGLDIWTQHTLFAWL